MVRRIQCIILSVIMIVSLIPNRVNASEPVQDNSVSDDEYIKWLLNEASTPAADLIIIQNMLEQSKFTGNRGFAFAAERGNDFIDKIKGNNTKVVGDNNLLNGPDREIILRNGEKIFIQDKYYSTAKGTIDACFGTEGFRYVDAQGNPMVIEVPSDQYADAVKIMRTKILNNEIPGVTDPAEAETLVRKGALTYKQAVNLAKAGTLESLTYDAAHGVVAASVAFGISTLVQYGIIRMNGTERGEAIKEAASDGLMTGGMAFATTVIASQLTKTGLLKVFTPSSEALVKSLGKNFAESLLKLTGENTVELSEHQLITHAAKALRATAITVVVTTIVFSTPDAIDMFRGRISKKQFIKNFAVSAVTVVVSTAGGYAGGALGNLIVPGVGTIPGVIVGGLLSGGVTGWMADKLADYITSDDADDMYKIFERKFENMCVDYLVTEQEAENIVKKLKKSMDEDFFKDMYQSKNREQFIEKKLAGLFETEVNKRPTYKSPSEKELRSELKKELASVVFIH